MQKFNEKNSDFIRIMKKIVGVKDTGFFFQKANPSINSFDSILCVGCSKDFILI